MGGEEAGMLILELLLWAAFFTVYLVCTVTACYLTFRKGYTLLGMCGILIPCLWLVGALLPARPGSLYEFQRTMRRQLDIADSGQAGTS
jgi:hypothetical protein